ncbi:MAG: tRNA (N6-threonylcarbamoyladenosine(37)-N6)-methyltransferase TrmO [Chloroflexota bacterium]
MLPPLKPIGIIHTPFTRKEETPIQSSRSAAEGRVLVFPEYSAGLEGIEGFSHLILLYLWHQAPAQVALRVKPFLGERETGLFATRYPCRPNPIGLSVVRLLERRGNELHIRGADMLDGSPLLDIKPYVPDFDVHPAERTGWYEQVNKSTP